MRLWIFHPLIFYPLVLLATVVIIGVSLKPQAWPRPAAPAIGAFADGALTFANTSFDAPEGAPNQNITVTRDFWGKAQTLRVAVLSAQPAPAPTEHGVRLLLTPSDAARLVGVPVTIDVSYNPLPVNAATGLAVSLQGAGPTQWQTQATPPQRATLRFQFPAQSSAAAIGIRAISDGGDTAFGLEITRIRVTPHPQSAAPN